MYVGRRLKHNEHFVVNLCHTVYSAYNTNDTIIVTIADIIALHIALQFVDNALSYSLYFIFIKLYFYITLHNTAVHYTIRYRNMLCLQDYNTKHLHHIFDCLAVRHSTLAQSAMYSKACCNAFIVQLSFTSLLYITDLL